MAILYCFTIFAAPRFLDFQISVPGMHYLPACCFMACMTLLSRLSRTALHCTPYATVHDALACASHAPPPPTRSPWLHGVQQTRHGVYECPLVLLRLCLCEGVVPGR